MAACLLLSLWLAAPAQGAPVNQCVDCHFSHVTHAQEAIRLAAWSHSAHAREGIGCHECHGGNPQGKTPWAAHQGVRPPDDIRSSVHHANVGETCGRCHPRQRRAFELTRHSRVVSAVARVSPACTTCHGAMSSRIPEPREVEQQCRVCHPGSRSVADRATVARKQLDHLQVLRFQLIQAESRIRVEHDAVRRLALVDTDRRAAAAYDATVDAFHSFDRTLVDLRLEQAARAVTALVTELRGR